MPMSNDISTAPTNDTVLTGITTTGTPHLGNYVGAIRPAIAASQDTNVDAYYFLADFHALIKCQDPAKVHESTREIAATWLALGLNTDNVVFYRQSDILKSRNSPGSLTVSRQKD